MTPPERWREIERVLDDALELPVADRGAFLDRACSGNRELRDEVERLLRAHDRATDFLEDPPPHAAAALLSDPIRWSDSTLVRPGTTIAERYVVERELGRGGMATVHLARDLKHQRPVAVKILDADFAHATWARRFLREIQITANLQHPHILPLHDSGDFDGLVYYVMPYVAGESLRDRLRREGPLHVDEAVRLAHDVAGALDYAHRRAVVHRDIKPANILLEEGQAIVADFGIARAISEAVGVSLGDPAGSATRPGVTLGTPAYMSPEQASGAQDLSAATDVYSLGCVVYEMLTGAPPFTAPTADAVIAKHLHATALPLREVRPDVPVHVERAISRALSKDPTARFQSAGGLVQALTLAETVPSATPVGDAGPTARTSRDKRARLRRAALGGFTIVLTAVVAAVMLTRHRPLVVGPAAAIAVFPLVPAVPDTELTRLGRELVITLSASLDGVGGIRTADALTVLANAPPTNGAPALTEARALARRLGARSVAYGSVMRVVDRARIDLALHPAADGEPLARVSVTAMPNDIAALTDSAAWGLLRQLWQRTDPPTPSLAAITTQSIPALRAFLNGERLVVGGRWRAASDAFQSAIALDSTFWLAYWRYAFTRDFNVLPVDSAIRTTYRAHRQEFPERDRLLVEAGMPDRTSARYERVKAITERFPDYWPGWWALTEYLAHTGPLFGTTDFDLRAALERTLALNPRMVSGLDHLFWVALWQRDTALSARLIRELTALRYDSISQQESGHDVLAFDRHLDALTRSGGVIRDTVFTEPLLRNIGSLTGPLSPHRFALGAAQYGFPQAQVELIRQVSARFPVARTAAAWRLGLAVAEAERGTWDSALVTMDQLVASTPDPIWPLYRYRLAVIGAWLGTLEPSVAARYRATVDGATERLLPANRAELVWLDGLLAVARNDARALTLARRALDDADSVTAPLLQRSLAAFGAALSGHRSRAADSLVALEQERAELGWSRYRSDGHPFLTGVNRLAAARWLVERGDAAAAERLLTWHQAVLFPLLHTREANLMVEPLAYLEQARVAEALGRRGLARTYYERFLWRYDAPVPSHRGLVAEASEALVRLREPGATERVR